MVQISIAQTGYKGQAYIRDRYFDSDIYSHLNGPNGFYDRSFANPITKGLIEVFQHAGETPPFPHLIQRAWSPSAA